MSSFEEEASLKSPSSISSLCLYFKDSAPAHGEHISVPQRRSIREKMHDPLRTEETKPHKVQTPEKFRVDFSVIKTSSVTNGTKVDYLLVGEPISQFKCKEQF